MPKRCLQVTISHLLIVLNFSFQKRLAKEARFQEAQAKNAAVGKKVKAPTAVKPIKSREASYYRVTCKVKTNTFLQLPCVFFSVASFYVIIDITQYL